MVAHPQVQEFLTVGEAASFLRMSRGYVRRMIRAGWIPGYRLGTKLQRGGRWRVLRSDLLGLFRADRVARRHETVEDEANRWRAIRQARRQLDAERTPRGGSEPASERTCAP